MKHPKWFSTGIEGLIKSTRKQAKNKKIVITNYGSRLNKGTTALLKCTIWTLENSIPDSEFAVFTYHPEIESELKNLKVFGVIWRPSRAEILPSLHRFLKCGVWAILQRYLHLDLRALIDEERICEYYTADAIVNTGGDLLTESYGTLSFLTSIINLLIALLLNVPVVLYSESIGPFKRIWNRTVAKFLLSNVKIIILRENISRNYLKELGVKGVPIYVTADQAFLLRPAPPRRVIEILYKEHACRLTQETGPLIGISASQIIYRYGFQDVIRPRDKYNKYVKVVAQITDYLIDEFNATVVFVPHVVEPGNDDRKVANDVYKIIKGKQKTVLIKREYTTEEIKGIIGQCDLFIGTRMHAMIASTSMCIPTVAIAYSYKTKGVMEDVGCKRYVLHVKDLNYDALVSLINDAWNNKTEIRKDLGLKMQRIRQRALLNGKLIRDLLNSPSIKESR